MNKSDYIREVNELHAPDSLRDKISELKSAPPVKVKKHKKFTAVIAACLAVFVLIGGAYGIGSASSASKSESEKIEIGYAGDSNNGNAANINESSDTFSNSSSQISDNVIPVTRKLVKKATVYLETKDSDELMKKIGSQVNSLNGYTSSLSQNKHDEYVSVETMVQIPAEKLDEFLDFLEKSGTVTSKNVVTKDITGSYTDTESQINAYETEEKALLGILAKCDTVEDTINVQDRLSQIRAELESLRAQKKGYDQEIAYSTVSIIINEVDRVKKAPTSFGSQVSEKFSESIYNIGQFFRNLSVFILGASPYLLIAAAVIVIVVLIIKKKRK